MVNGSSMLSTTPSSLLLSTALPSMNAGSAAGENSATATLPGFAELLSSFAAKVSGAGEADVIPAETPVAGEADTAEPAILAKGAIESGVDFTEAAVPAKAALESGPGFAGAAIPAKAAIVSGKILPAGLPEAEEAATGDAMTLPVEAAEEIEEVLEAAALEAPGAVDPLAAIAAAIVAPQQAPAASSKPQRSGAMAAPLPQPAAAVAAIKPAAKSGEAPAANAPVQAVSISATTETAAAAVEMPAAAAAAPEAAKPALPKAQRAEAPAQPLPQAAQPAPALADAAPVPSAQPVPAVSAPAAMPTPADINAALDRLVAAREALMPAEAALAIDHADFGEVSIRFEQRADGRLSAELRAADPELQRAVTAAVGADRGLSMGAEGDGSRSMNLANQRGSTAGGDAASGERSQPGQERDMNQRRGNARPTAHEGNEPRPGVFA